MKQQKLDKGQLLDEHGELHQAGYAFDLIKEYNRKDIKAGKSRIKEWDYYYVGDENYGIALTVADNSYMSLISVSFLDFKKKTDITKSKINWLTFGKVSLPASSKDGHVSYEKKNFKMNFYNELGKRRLCCELKNFVGKQLFKCDFVLSESSPHSIVIATPFFKKKHFYYNQKINHLLVNGTFSIGEQNYEFKNALGVLDWGRGVWTYKNTWYWASLSSKQDGHFIGFNLGYGFGDTSNASENVLFFDDKVYKLEDIVFNIPKDKKGRENYLEPWTLTSIDKNVDIVFTPILDRFSDSNVLIIRSLQHQVFGYFSGTISINGEIFKINKSLGFAEKVFNKW